MSLRSSPFQPRRTEETLIRRVCVFVCLCVFLGLFKQIALTHTHTLANKTVIVASYCGNASIHFVLITKVLLQVF